MGTSRIRALVVSLLFAAAVIVALVWPRPSRPPADPPAAPPRKQAAGVPAAPPLEAAGRGALPGAAFHGVRGAVVTAGGDPIPGAIVHAVAHRDLVVTATTGPDGRFSLPLPLEVDRALVVADSPDFARECQSVRLPAETQLRLGNGTSLTVRLTPGPGVHVSGDVTVSLEWWPAALLDVLRPGQGVRPPFPEAAATRTAVVRLLPGEVSFDRLPDGEVRIKAWDSEALATGSGRVRLAAESGPVSVDVWLAAPGRNSLRGTVLARESGAPLAGALVEPVWRDGPGPGWPAVRTDEGGGFETAGASWPEMFRVSAPGRETAYLGPGRSDSPVMLAEECSFVFTLTDRDGRPLAGIDAEERFRNDHLGRSDAGGRLHLSGYGVSRGVEILFRLGRDHVAWVSFHCGARCRELDWPRGIVWREVRLLRGEVDATTPATLYLGARSAAPEVPRITCRIERSPAFVPIPDGAAYDGELSFPESASSGGQRFALNGFTPTADGALRFDLPGTRLRLVAGAGRTGGPFELGLVPGPDVLARLDAARVGTFYPSSEMAWVVVTPGRETIVEGLLPGVYGICGAKGEDLEGQWDIRDTDEVQTFEAPPPRR